MDSEKQSQQRNDGTWKIVGPEEVARDTKDRNEKRAKTEAAIEALKQLEIGDALSVVLPEKSPRDADYVRGWWRSKMLILSNGLSSKKFMGITSSDSKVYFIQRKR